MELWHLFYDVFIGTLIILGNNVSLADTAFEYIPDNARLLGFGEVPFNPGFLHKLVKGPKNDNNPQKKSKICSEQTIFFFISKKC